MPCYEPPESDPQVFDLAQQAMRLQAREQRYVATLKEIEEACRAQVYTPGGWGRPYSNLARHILDVIDSHWRS